MENFKELENMGLKLAASISEPASKESLEKMAADREDAEIKALNEKIRPAPLPGETNGEYAARTGINPVCRKGMSASLRRVYRR